MAFGKDKGPIEFHIDPDGPNALISERNNTVMMFRKVAWNNRQPRLELRNWVVEENGERPMRGISFANEETVHNLVNVMTGIGYGDTKVVLGNLKERPDFEPALVDAIGMQKVIEAKNTEVEKVADDEYFDPRNMIG